MVACYTSTAAEVGLVRAGRVAEAIHENKGRVEALTARGGARTGKAVIGASIADSVAEISAART